MFASSEALHLGHFFSEFMAPSSPYSQQPGMSRGSDRAGLLPAAGVLLWRWASAICSSRGPFLGHLGEVDLRLRLCPVSISESLPCMPLFWFFHSSLPLHQRGGFGLFKEIRLLGKLWQGVLIFEDWSPCNGVTFQKGEADL